MGTLKRAWLARELGEQNLDLQLQIKACSTPTTS
ncbi:hypothetical protein AB0M54_06635 [Actinoplanes sp. NPDC051470]